MSAPTRLDPWASHDHDPTSIVAATTHRAHIATRHALTLARADIHEAVANQGQARHQFALSARDYAQMVLTAADATAVQRELANYYLADAEILAHN